MLSIVNATLKDIPAIQYIAATTWPVTYGTILSDAQLQYMLQLMYSQEALEQQFTNGHQFYIAQFNEKNIGFASASKENETTCKLNKLYVLPTIQKTGAGKALLQQVVAYAKHQQLTSIVLQVNRHNNAKDFYIKQGFTIQQEADFDIGHGYYMNDYVMALHL